MTQLKIAIVRGTAHFLLLALLALVGCNKNPIAEDSDKATDYRTVVNVLNDCDSKFYSSFILVKDRESADYMLKCLRDTTGKLSKTIVDFEKLPPLEVPENLKYVELMTDAQLDYQSMLQSPPPAAIATEMVESVELYMVKRLEFLIRFGLVLKPEQLSDKTQ